MGGWTVRRVQRLSLAPSLSCPLSLTLKTHGMEGAEWLRMDRMLNGGIFGVQGAGGSLSSALHFEGDVWSTGVPRPPRCYFQYEP